MGHFKVKNIEGVVGKILKWHPNNPHPCIRILLRPLGYAYKTFDFSERKSSLSGPDLIRFVLQRDRKHQKDFTQKIFRC